MSAEAFYERDGDRFVASELTRGPWDRRFQHGGPVAALLARTLASALPDGDTFRLARIVVELARPAPIAAFRARAELLHSGRRVATTQAELIEGERLVARARGLFLSERELEPAPPPPEAIPRLVPSPDESAPLVLPFFVEPVGYHTAMELRLAHGRFGSGTIACWMRMRVALVAGEPDRPEARALVCADSGNGVSMYLDPARWTFVNADLIVSLSRLPRGEWIGLEARTLVEEAGVGLADTALHDAAGQIGRGTQSLVIEPRPR